MPDANTLLRETLDDFRKNDQPRLISICQVDDRNCVLKRNVAVCFLAFMLATTIVYMAWNVYEVNLLRRRIQNESDERIANKTRAGQVIDEMLRLKDWKK